MIAKYFDSKLPEDSHEEAGWLRREFEGAYSWQELHSKWTACDTRHAADVAIRGVVAQVDEYIEKTAPFKLAKDMDANGEAVATILHQCCEALRIASVLLWPFIPNACEAFWERIGCDYAAQMKANGGLGKLDEWTQWGQLEPGTAITKGDPLFMRYTPPKED